LKKASPPTKRASGRSRTNVAKAALISPLVLALRLDLQPHGASGDIHLSQCALGIRGIGRIDKHGHANGCRHQLTQELQPLCYQLTIEKIDPCQIAARPGETGDLTIDS